MPKALLISLSFLGIFMISCTKSQTCVCTDYNGKELYRQTHKYSKQSSKQRFEDDCLEQDKIAGQHCTIN